MMNKGRAELWFEETLELDYGCALRIRVRDKIESLDSEFQNVAIYDTDPFGRMLVLDGTIQCTEFDESSYQEMISHPALFTHPQPEKVAVIGGGDGGVVREILRHKSVREVHLVEIDPVVTKLARKHLPKMSSALSDEKVSIYHEDGTVFLQQKKNYYDIIIVDSSDPVGPAVALFQTPFFRDVFNALREDGIFVNQCESMFYHRELIQKIVHDVKGIFPIVEYYYTMIPTYPSGNIGFCFASKKHLPTNFRKEDCQKIQEQLSYYCPDIHLSSFHLPIFMSRILGGAK